MLCILYCSMKVRIHMYEQHGCKQRTTYIRLINDIDNGYAGGRWICKNKLQYSRETDIDRNINM